MTTATADAVPHPAWRQVLNVAAYALVITINALANALPINGITSGAVSDRYPTFVTPAGYVFAIWGVIYALLAFFVGWQALPVQRDDRRMQRLAWPSRRAVHATQPGSSPGTTCRSNWRGR